METSPYCEGGGNETVVTAHGFRSSFRVWCAEQTSFPRDVAEAALAHVVRDATEAAYMRSTFFEKRRELMTEWSLYATARRLSATADQHSTMANQAVATMA